MIGLLYMAYPSVTTYTGYKASTVLYCIQGLGKTVQTIAFCAALLQKTGTPQDSLASSGSQLSKYELSCYMYISQLQLAALSLTAPTSCNMSTHIFPAVAICTGGRVFHTCILHLLRCARHT